MAKLEIYYNSPEGPKSQMIKSDEDPLKLISAFLTKGLNIVRDSDQYYVPPGQIIGIQHVKVNV